MLEKSFLIGMRWGNEFIIMSMTWAWRLLLETVREIFLKRWLLQDTIIMWVMKNMEDGKIGMDQVSGPFMVNMPLCPVCLGWVVTQ